MAKKTDKKLIKDIKEKAGFAGLLASSKPAPAAEPPTKKKSDKPKIVLSKADADVLDNFCVADEIFKVAKSKQEFSKSVAHDLVDPKYISLCVENGVLPANPQIISEESSLNFQAKHVSRFTLAKNPDGSTKSVEEMLKENGFEESVCEEIINHVITTTEYFGIKPLNVLQDGTQEEKALCDKLSDLISENFTKAEQEKIIEHYKTVVVDSSWKERAVVLACKSDDEEPRSKKEKEERLAKLFEIIPIQMTFSHSTTKKSFNSSISDFINQPVSEEEKVVLHENYKFKSKGLELKIYLCAGKKEVFLGTKKCDNAGHIDASVKKFIREPDALKAQIKKFDEEPEAA